MQQWLTEFPDFAMRGQGLGDLSIIQDWKRMCAQNPAHRVCIWSLDQHLASHDRQPSSYPHAGYTRSFVTGTEQAENTGTHGLKN